MKQLYRIIWIVCLLSMALLFSASPDPAYAATINVDGTTCTLADAITSANVDAVTGGCSGGSGADVLNLTNNINLTAVLPDITSDITIEGNGYTIARTGGPNFRILTVAGSGTLTLNNATVTNGAALDGFPNNNGGGILVNSGGTATLNNSTISSNSAIANGGGVHCNICTLNLNNSTMSANTARVGGGINVAGASTVTVFNSTISGNSADDNGGGIAKAFGDGTISINFSTITNNTADANSSGTGDGGGIFANSNTTIQNSIVQGNFDLSTPALNDCNSDTNISSNGHNVVGAGCPSGGTEDTTAAASLGALADNGGPTLTHMPQSGSPAIDAGDNATCPAADQRGQLRTDYTCDIGAVEVQFSDSDTTSKTVIQGGTYTFGPTLARVQVVDDGNGCLTGISIQRVNSNHPQADSEPNPRLQTGVYWDITGIGCSSGFTVTLTLPTPNFTPDASDKLCRYASGAWDCGEAGENSAFSATMSDSSLIDVIVRQEVNAFSQWAAGESVGPTAVTLASLAAAPVSTIPLIALAALFLLLLSGSWLVVGRRR